jgi:hypothetical protein
VDGTNEQLTVFGKTKQVITNFVANLKYSVAYVGATLGNSPSLSLLYHLRASDLLAVGRTYMQYARIRWGSLPPPDFLNRLTLIDIVSVARLRTASELNLSPKGLHDVLTVEMGKSRVVLLETDHILEAPV